MIKPVLRVYRGLPGSGKTTSAIKWRGLDPANRALVSRDDFRSMFNGYTSKTSEHENVITLQQKAVVRSLLASGISVALHDTNLPRRRVREWLALAESEGADWEVEDLAHKSLWACLEGNSARPHWEQVPSKVIHEKWERYCKGQPDPREIEWVPVGAPSELEVEPYARPLGLPRAVICDLDGTIADMTGIRGPHEYDRVGEDEVHWDVVGVLESIGPDRGLSILYVTGRPEGCRRDTEEWLLLNGLPEGELLMRTDQEQKDGIADDRVKLRLFNEHIRHNYDVRYVLDDRDRVVRLWRSLGLRCLQVAEGSF